MLRACPKCANRNHISAFVCPCGYRLVGTPEPKSQVESEWATAPPYQETLPAKSPDLSSQPSPQPLRELAQERQKQAIREALLAEESQKPAREKLKINLKRSFAAASLLIVFGALALAVLSGFTDIAENSEVVPVKKEQTSLTDKSLASDARYSAANNSTGKNSVEGKVVDVGSGDTLTVADDNGQEYQIKLEGIDAPELEQDFGRESQKNLFTLVFGKTVQVNWQEPGAGGLITGKVLLNGKNVSLEQLKAGLAWHDKNAALEQSENDLYAYHETITKENGFGLWSAANPLPPWEYRSETKNFNQVKNSKQAENQAAVSDTNGESQATADDTNEILETANNVESEAKTTIVKETRNAAESQTASTQIAPRPDIKSPMSIESPPSAKSPTSIKSSPSIVVSPSPQKVLTVVSTGYERKTTAEKARAATARCGDGTLSYSATPSEICAGRGGVAEWLDASTASRAKISPRGGNNNSAPRADSCFVIDNGKKVYLEREICGNR